MFINLYSKTSNLIRNNIGKFLLSLFIIVSSASFGILDAYAESMYDIRVIIDGKWNYFKANDEGTTIQDFLQENKIDLHKKDKVNLPLNKKIDSDLRIYIEKAKKVTFKIDGEKSQEFFSNKELVGLVLKEFEEEIKRDFILKEGQSSAMNVKNGMEILISPYKEEIETIKKDIPFETEYVENETLLSGTERVKVNGQSGAKEIKTKHTYINGKLSSSELISEVVIKQPINKIIEKGTRKVASIKTEKGTFTYSKKILVKSTAYTAGPESTGKRPGDRGYGITASGMKAQKGVVAVDTRYIPFGTKLYIEGYGYAIAGDTGSAIKGNKIDVFFDKYSDAINYGVRNVNVYILDEKIA